MRCAGRSMDGTASRQLCSLTWHGIANSRRTVTVYESLRGAAFRVDRPMVRHPKEVRSGAPHVSVSLNDCACQAGVRQHYRTSLAFPTFPLFTP